VNELANALAKENKASLSLNSAGRMVGMFKMSGGLGYAPLTITAVLIEFAIKHCSCDT